jgi:hypothetical protein
MPCRVDDYPPDYENPSTLRIKADALTAENDRLREVILRLTEDPGYKVPKTIMNKIRKDQVEHRKEDLARLERKFIKNRDTERLNKVWAADPKKPLEPQLGFDPDEF